jgi:hypothetical protein
MNMKKRIALGAAMLLTLGTAVASTLMYGNESTDATPQAIDGAALVEVAPSRETIETWKATAASADYVSAKRPI